MLAMAENIVVCNAGPLQGTVELAGAKNAVLPIIISMILTSGVSRIRRVPASQDVYVLIDMLSGLGARVTFDEEMHELVVDTTDLFAQKIPSEIMQKMRASVLAMGPLLARFGWSELAFPGGDAIGARPIDFHLRAFAAMGAEIENGTDQVKVMAKELVPQRFILDYPSVGATENILMAAVLVPGQSQIVNAALEPEVFDLITVLRKMGAKIDFAFPATIIVHGVKVLHPVEHDVIFDRLEAGTFLLAAAVTGGEITIPGIEFSTIELFVKKLRDMGHKIIPGVNGYGVSIKSTNRPIATTFKTMPFPGFPTDLQAPTTAALCYANGVSVITETVFENRMHHVGELVKMGAQITVSGSVATITGVDRLFGTAVAANDIRVAAALVLAGLRAEGETTISGVHHLERGYDALDEKLRALGACIKIVRE